jgi:hypothetical protein
MSIVPGAYAKVLTAIHDIMKVQSLLPVVEQDLSSHGLPLNLVVRLVGFSVDVSSNFDLDFMRFGTHLSNCALICD